MSLGFVGCREETEGAGASGDIVVEGVGVEREGDV